MTIDANDILKLTKSVTKEWTRQRKAEDRGNRSRNSRQYVYSDRINFTDIADRILPRAYEHASGGNYTVSKRQLYYACREEFRRWTGRELEFKYFANTLLVQYLNRHPEASSWKVTADPRGMLSIPNCGHAERIPCGTIQIENHLADTQTPLDPLDEIADGLRIEWPSPKAGERYQAVLYIEKEGFEPQLKEAKIAERFDLAILSCKGQSVVAARRFVDEVCRIDGGVPLFVVHDFDKAGFEISQRLTQVSDWAEFNDRVSYRFQNDINVTDLGLRLDDVKQYELASEYCRFNGYFARDSICTSEEKEFLRSNRRVELNAFTSPQFIEWLEKKLTAAGLTERLIPSDDILADAYRRAYAIAEINQAIEDIREEAIQKASGMEIPQNLREELRAALKDSGNAWDKTLYTLAQTKVSEQD